MSYILSPISSNIVIPTTINTVTPLTQVVPFVPGFPIVPTIRVSYDSGLHDNWMIQRDANKYLWHRILDYWIHKDKMESIRKFMVIKDGKVFIVTSKKEYDENNVSKESISGGEIKSDYLEDEIGFSKDIMRKLIIKIIDELGMKWQFLTGKKEELIVVGVVKRYLKKKLREMAGIV